MVTRVNFFPRDLVTQGRGVVSPHWRLGYNFVVVQGWREDRWGKVVAVMPLRSKIGWNVGGGGSQRSVEAVRV